MAEKLLQTRILNKVDTLEKWNKSALKLKKGEIALATVAASAGTGLEEPVVMMKIGTEEEKTFAELPWSFYAKASDVLSACKSEDALTAFVKGVIDNADMASNEDFKDLVAAVDKLNGDATKDGSVAKSIADAIDALKLAETYAAKKHEHTKAEITDFAHEHAMDDVDGLGEALNGKADKATTLAGYNISDAYTKTEVDEAISDANDIANAKVASVTAGDASVTVGGTATAPTVAAKLSQSADNALELAEDGLKVVIPAAAEYSIVKAADSGDYAAVYNLTKDGTIVGVSINIPKDMVVKSGSVVNDEIVLVLNDEDETEIKIPVASLIEYVTSGSSVGDMVVVEVSEDHKVTATISDGTITLAKLTTDVQTAIGKAHSHDNADVLNGIDATDIENWNDAVAKEHEHGNWDVINTITAEQVSAWDEADGKAHEHKNFSLLETYTQTEVNLADAVAKKHEHDNKDVIDGIDVNDVASWNAKLENVTAAEDSGLKATKTGNSIAIEIDDKCEFIFDCGTSAV